MEHCSLPLAPISAELWSPSCVNLALILSGLVNLIRDRADTRVFISHKQSPTRVNL